MDKFKKCKVLLLPTAKEPYKMPYSETIPKGTLILTKETTTWYEKGLRLALKGNTIGNYSKEMWYNLYITSDEEIKEGDWCIRNYGMGQELVKYHKDYGNQCKKVIATTDTSLYKEIKMVCRTCKGSGLDAPNNCKTCNRTGIRIEKEHLPQPSQAFIEKYVEEYNKGDKITEVMVEYEKIPLTVEDLDYPDLDGEYRPDYKLKVNLKDNTITIKKVKDSWNREEVIALITNYANNYSILNTKINKNLFDKWIEENL